MTVTHPGYGIYEIDDQDPPPRNRGRDGDPSGRPWFIIEWFRNSYDGKESEATYASQLLRATAVVLIEQRRAEAPGATRHPIVRHRDARDDAPSAAEEAPQRALARDVDLRRRRREEIDRRHRVVSEIRDLLWDIRDRTGWSFERAVMEVAPEVAEAVIEYYTQPNCGVPLLWGREETT